MQASRRIAGVTSFVIMLVSFSAPGCVDDSEGDVEGVGWTDAQMVDEPCLTCAENAWACSCTFVGGVTAFLSYYCWGGDEILIDGECDNDCRYGNPFATGGDAIRVACSVTSEMKCDAWAPDQDVSYDSGADVYSVGHGFVAGLIQDPEALWGCDDAVLVALPGGSFEVRGAERGELLYELGLRDGDVALTINGYTLEDYNDAAIAFVDLWLSVQETNYVLEVQRGSGVVEFDYELVAE